MKNNWEALMNIVAIVCGVEIVTGMVGFAITTIVWMQSPEMAVDSKFLGLYALLLIVAGNALMGFLLWLKHKVH